MTQLLERIFHLKGNNTSVRTELLAGITTFSTMAYIIFINPKILSETGMDYGAVMVATVLSSFVATLFMSLYANYPFALAPGMGLNAYFTYGIVLGAGYSWETALGASFVAGILFLILTFSHLREKIMDVIPHDLRTATTGGVGLFLVLIGLKSVDFIVPNEQTLLSLGNLGDPNRFMTLFGVIVLVSLLSRNVKGAILITILLNWTIGYAAGYIEWNGFFGTPPSLAPTFLKLDIKGALTLPFIPIILSFVFIAIFDTAGTLFGLCKHGGFLTPEGKIPRVQRAMTADGVGTAFGAMVGTAPFTTYLESVSGVHAGGKTGLTALVVALLFLASLFIAPFASSVPAFATSPILIVIGALMVKEGFALNFDDLTEYIPGFIILIGIPLTFSIATGIALGFVTYPLIKLLTGRHKEIHWLIWVIAFLFALKFVFE